MQKRMKEDIKFKDEIYIVSCNNDNSVLLAMFINIRLDYISWFDTRRQRQMKIKKVIDSSNNHFVFERADGFGKNMQVYTLEPLTLDRYNIEIKPKLLKAPDFKTAKQMKQRIMKTVENAV